MGSTQVVCGRCGGCVAERRGAGGAGGRLDRQLGASDVFPVGQEINYQTLRQIVRLSAGGKQVRVRFSNETGHYPLVIGAAHIAKPATDGPEGTIGAATDRALTFGGLGGITIPPGAAALSDPVDMELAPLSKLAVSLFVPRWTGPSVIHLDGVATTQISGDGDFTLAPAIPLAQDVHVAIFHQ